MIHVSISENHKIISTTSAIHQSPSRDFTVMSTDLMSSNVVPYYSAVTIGQESANMYTPFLNRDLQDHHTKSFLSTTPLASHPLLMTSSPNNVLKSIPAVTSSLLLQSLSTAIQESSTILAFIPSTAASFVTKEKRIFEQDIAFISSLNTSDVDVRDEEMIEKVLKVATNLIKTNQTIPGRKHDPGMQAVEVLQALGNSISQQLDLGNKSSVAFEKTTDELVFGVAVINSKMSSGFSFPSKKKKNSSGENIFIPSSVFHSNSDKTYFVGIIFKAYNEMKNNTGNEGFVMGTKVINAVVSPPPSDVLKEPVQMIFKKNIANSFAAECTFWVENSFFSGEHGRWSTRECFRTFENESHVKCGCYHLTNFAVLFKVTDNEASKEHSFRLVIITYVGLSLSILGCLLTFIIYVSLQTAKTDRAIIHTNLVLALGVADAIFLVTVAVKPVEKSCLALAMLAFYFYLAVFFWMLVEGVYIYLMVIKVFRGNVARRRRMAYLVGWGCPLLVAIITYAVLTHDAVSKYHCWLSVESGAIWAFVGPGLAIILVNCIILLGVIRTTWTTFADDIEFGGLKSATKTFGAVIPILGITWVFGVMAFNESSVVFQYIFAITNSIQGGLIFVLYCLVSKEVRNELLHRVSIWLTRRGDVTSSSGSRRNNLISGQTRQRSQEKPQELKNKKTPIERSFLLDDTTQSTAKGSAMNVAKGAGESDDVNSKADHSVNKYGHA